MPTYEYHCPKCKTSYDLREGFNAETTHPCENCGKGIAKRVLHAPKVFFKGSGFYVTDSKGTSKSKGTAATDSSSSNSDADSGANSDSSAKSEPKAESKSDSKPEKAAAPAKPESKSESKSNSAAS